MNFYDTNTNENKIKELENKKTEIENELKKEKLKLKEIEREKQKKESIIAKTDNFLLKKKTHKDKTVNFDFKFKKYPMNEKLIERFTSFCDDDIKITYNSIIEDIKDMINQLNSILGQVEKEVQNCEYKID